MTDQDPINRDYLEQNAEDTGRDIVAKINEVHGPQWKHRLELTKLMVSLTSAILVGTITFSGTLIQSKVPQNPSWLLILSWALILASLIAALGSFWAHSNLLSFHPRWVNSMPTLRSRFEKLKPNSPNLVQDILDIIGQESIKALEPVGKADIWSNRLLKSSFATFVVGLICFLIFGACQI
ncbi:MAG: hypothetical protein COB19_02195 [Porticoccus sp.]|nr:MAG: hypothetical protein COB19_02195 [Porticoccus sp.]